MQLLAFLSALALLVCDTAAGLAGGLAGGLALAAATVLGAVAQIAGLNGLDMFHNFTFYINFKYFYFITMQFVCQSHFSYFSHLSLYVTITDTNAFRVRIRSVNTTVALRKFIRTNNWAYSQIAELVFMLIANCTNLVTDV